MKRRTFISLMGVMAAAGVLSLTGCSDKTAASSTASSAPLNKLDSIQKSGKLVVALEGAWQPWSYHDSSDTLVGYDVEVSRAIAEKLERRKEIGILRAIGASKHNVSQVFNAETFIIGLCSGVMGVVLCLLLLIPGNMLIHHIAGDVNVVASLPPQAALILIVLATLLTMLGGVIPARSAAKSNPVKALRSE